MVDQYNAFAASRHVLERIADMHPEFGDLPVSRDDGDWPAWLDRALETTYLSDGEKILLDIGAGLWTERHPFVGQLIGLDEENRKRVLEAVVALSGMRDELGGGQVVDGRFGPQFTIAERSVMAHALTLLGQIVDSLNEAGVFPQKFELAGRDMLDDYAARLIG